MAATAADVLSNRCQLTSGEWGGCASARVSPGVYATGGVALDAALLDRDGDIAWCDAGGRIDESGAYVAYWTGSALVVEDRATGLEVADTTDLSAIYFHIHFMLVES